MWYLKLTHISMTLVVVSKKNTHAMALLDPCVVSEENTHPMTLVVVSKKSTHAMTLVDPYADCEKSTHFSDTGGSICGM